jgi:hypothetical protein
MRLVLFIGMSSMIAAAACAPAINYERQTARAIVPTPYPDSVRISEVKAHFTTSSWVATTPNAVYDCSMDAGERTPICAKRHP